MKNFLLLAIFTTSIGITTEARNTQIQRVNFLLNSYKTQTEVNLPQFDTETGYLEYVTLVINGATKTPNSSIKIECNDNVYFDGEIENNFSKELEVISINYSEFIGKGTIPIKITTNGSSIDLLTCEMEFAYHYRSTEKLAEADIKSLNIYYLKENMQIYWSAGSEFDVDQFEIEYSVDNRRFYEIGVINGTEFTSYDTNYFFDDPYHYNRGYYRVKVLENDGNALYSNILDVSHAQDNDKETRVVSFAKDQKTNKKTDDGEYKEGIYIDL